MQLHVHGQVHVTLQLRLHVQSRVTCTVTCYTYSYMLHVLTQLPCPTTLTSLFDAPFITAKQQQNWHPESVNDTPILSVCRQDHSLIVYAVAYMINAHAAHATLACPCGLVLHTSAWHVVQILKVLHGADRDIQWLQRDFGIYIANMFDTGQASRVLEYPGHGLAYLLQHFCAIKVRCCAVLCCAVPCCAGLGCAVLCCALLCCAWLCCLWLAGQWSWLQAVAAELGWAGLGCCPCCIVAYLAWDIQASCSLSSTSSNFATMLRRDTAAVSILWVRSQGQCTLLLCSQHPQVVLKKVFRCAG